MSNEKLLPCPFCGEHCATLEINQGDKWAHYEPSCLEVRTGYIVKNENAPWRKDAIKAWNTRKSPQPNEADVVEVIGKEVEDALFWWEKSENNDCNFSQVIKQALTKALSDNGYNIVKRGE